MWGPREGGALMRLESLLESFTLKIQGFQKFNYWQRLEKLKMLSISRRFERYKIIYCHKILYDMTDNCGLNWNYSDKTGYKFVTVKCRDRAVTRREQSFQYIGPRLYNTLPSYLRMSNEVSLDTWKNTLDKYLETIPDNPITSKITSGLCNLTEPHRPTNSLLRWPNSSIRRNICTPTTTDIVI